MDEAVELAYFAGEMEILSSSRRDVPVLISLKIMKNVERLQKSSETPLIIPVMVKYFRNAKGDVVIWVVVTILCIFSLTCGLQLNRNAGL